MKKPQSGCVIYKAGVSGARGGSLHSGKAGALRSATLTPSHMRANC